MRMMVLMIRMIVGGVDGGDDVGFDQKKGEDTFAEGQSRSFSYSTNLNHTS